MVGGVGHWGCELKSVFLYPASHFLRFLATVGGTASFQHAVRLWSQPTMHELNPAETINQNKPHSKLCQVFCPCGLRVTRNAISTVPAVIPTEVTQHPVSDPRRGTQGRVHTSYIQKPDYFSPLFPFMLPFCFCWSGPAHPKHMFHIISINLVAFSFTIRCTLAILCSLYTRIQIRSIICSITILTNTKSTPLLKILPIGCKLHLSAVNSH